MRGSTSIAAKNAVLLAFFIVFMHVVLRSRTIPSPEAPRATSAVGETAIWPVGAPADGGNVANDAKSAEDRELLEYVYGRAASVDDVLPSAPGAPKSEAATGRGAAGGSAYTPPVTKNASPLEDKGGLRPFEGWGTAYHSF
jgi:hypothetical protein